jgi:hypothetical protein
MTTFRFVKGNRTCFAQMRDPHPDFLVANLDDGTKRLFKSLN